MRSWKWRPGSGEMFRRLVRANRGGATLGVDLSPNMAWRTQDRVQREFPDSTTQCQAVDARHMPFRDATFDAVFCCYLLELLSGDDIMRTMEEFHRVLRRRGQLVLVLIGQNKAAFNGLYFSGGQGGAGVLGPAGGRARSRAGGSERLPHRARGHSAAELLPFARAGGAEKRGVRTGQEGRRPPAKTRFEACVVGQFGPPRISSTGRRVRGQVPFPRCGSFGPRQFRTLSVWFHHRSRSQRHEWTRLDQMPGMPPIRRPPPAVRACRSGCLQSCP